MAAGRADLYIEQGADWIVNISLYRDFEQTIPFDLTGYLIEMQIRKDAGSCNVTAEPAIAVVDATGGKIQVLLTRQQTRDIPVWGKSYEDIAEYVYDLYIKEPDGIRLRILNGYIRVSPGVTRNEL